MKSCLCPGGSISTVANHSELIGAVYDCALDATKWSVALTSLREELGFHNATLALQSFSAATPVLSASSGIEPEWLTRIPDHSSDFIERWGGLARLRSLPLAKPAVLSWVNPKSHWESTGYYREWARPQGLTDVMAIGTSFDQLSVGSIIFGRHERRTAITREDVARAQPLVPHLQRAVAMGGVLGQQIAFGMGLAAVLDCLTPPVLLVDSALRIRYANPAAQRELDIGGVLIERGATLRIASPKAHAILAKAVTRIGGKRISVGDAAHTIPLRDVRGHDRLLHALPLHIDSPWALVETGAVAAIMITPIAGPVGGHVGDVAKLFGLTATESAVLGSIVSGHTLTTVARIHGVGIATVKTHLQHLFDKTGVRRQSDLVSLVASLRLPVPHGSSRSSANTRSNLAL